MERLSAQDLSNLWPDDFGWPQDIGVIGVLDGAVPLDVVRRTVEARLHLVPRFRQRLYRPRRGLGWPLWVDAQDFDITDHIGLVALPDAAGEADLLSTVEQLRRRPWDYSRPLWRMWILPGLAEHRTGLYVRVHHAIADGAAGVALLGTLFDPAAGPDAAAGSRFVPAPVPSGRELLADNVRRRAGELTRAASALGHPARTLGRLRAGWPAVRETVTAPRAPRTSLNRLIGEGRRFAVVRGAMEPVAQAAHAAGATVNDVLLTAIAGGLRNLLRSRGEQVDALVLRAYVPVALHRGRSGPARGNLVGVMAVPLPLGGSDTGRRLARIAAETAERRKRFRPWAGALLRNGLLQRSVLRRMPRQRWANMYVANVPGPPAPLSVAGAAVRDLFPIVPLTGNIPLGVGALSYSGQFNLTVVADRDACPDVAVFVDGMREDLGCLTLAARPTVPLTAAS